LASIRALKLVLETIPNARLVLVGGGDMADSLRSEIRLLGLNENIVFAGRVGEASLPDYYKACDLNVYPNLSQTYGLPPLEALAAGKVSIVSNQSGVASLLERHRAAIVVDPTPASIARAIVDYNQGHYDTQGILERGKRLLLGQLTWDQYVIRMGDIFEDAINRR
jgi:glycosyltransferase involved in cell wall biosynthesis